jgi:hypothetical protein
MAFRSFELDGRRFRLDERPAVRARDVTNLQVTLVADDGSETIVHPYREDSALRSGVPPGGDLYNPRLFVEEILALGFDDRWLRVMVDWSRRHHLFKSAEHEA